MQTINNCDIKALAGEYGTPVYIYDEERIRNNFNRLNDAFSAVYPNTKIHYSVKANSNIHILKVFNEIGAGVDCSSPMELLLAEKAGFTGGRMLYTGNYESLNDLGKALGYGLRLNLDDINSFRRIQNIGIPEQVSFRINPGIGRGGFEGITTAGTDAKFGVPYEMAYEAYNLAIQSGVREFGIHMMTGSNNLEPYYFAEIVDKLMTVAGKVFTKLGIKPSYIDIGGGFGIPYEDGDSSLDVNETAALVSEVFIEKCEKYQFGTPDLVLEPGRYLIADTGYLVASVTGVKKSYKTFVGLDAGMNTLIRPALYGAKHRVYVYGKDQNEHLVNLCGQICENSDIFAKNQPFPHVEEGDIVIFRDAGAYGYSMSSNYNNRPKPAEVLVNGSSSRLIRRRENEEDMLRLY
jgi:diaminopimelate decarboxylase